MFTSPNMSLTVWDQNNDLYDHTQLADNFERIDGHNHEGPPNGVQLGTNALLDFAVTAPKIADNAAVPRVIPDLSITGAKIAENTIPISKLIDREVPLGSVLMWWRWNPNVAAPGLTPSGIGHLGSYVIAAGQTLASQDHDFHTVGLSPGTSVILPNLVKKYVQGADINGTQYIFGGTPIGNEPTLHGGPNGIPVVGGIGQEMGHVDHLINLSHNHSVPGHTHTVPPHVHVIGSDGSHRHKWLDDDGNAVDPMQRPYRTQDGVAFRRNALFVPKLHYLMHDPGNDERPAPMLEDGEHDHGGYTNHFAFPVTAEGIPVPGTAQVSSTSVTTGTGLQQESLTPDTVALLFIVKVKR